MNTAQKVPKRRALLYILLALAGIAVCIVRVGMVKADRAKSITAFESEWARSGKPVVTRTIESQDVRVYSQFTVRGVSGKAGKGFVTGEIKNALRPGQEIYGEDKSAVCATVVSVGSDLDLNTGMFPVEVEFYKPCDPDSFVVVAAHTRTLRNVLVVPNEVLDISGGEYSLWKIDNGLAKKVRVKVSSRNGYGAVISEGLQSGDAVVFRGQSNLRENDKVMVTGS